MSKQESKQKPAQEQSRQPGIEDKMIPKPQYDNPNYHGSGKLKEKIAIITGGDSGIGRAVAVAFAKEGAKICITYLDEHNDAKETVNIIESKGSQCIAISGDIGYFDFCKTVIEKVIQTFGSIDILINNAAEQHPHDNFEDITVEQLEKTFRTNIFSYFFMVKAAFKHLKKGSTIINTTSVTAYKGSDHLIDYSATKGAIVAFTRSLSENLIKKGIRVNGVAPGPIWTPLIPASFDAKEVEKFGNQVPMKRAGEPYEIAPSYVFLASDDAAYMSGQILHPNGGVIING